jgi:hypothetical protein
MSIDNKLPLEPVRQYTAQKLEGVEKRRSSHVGTLCSSLEEEIKPRFRVFSAQRGQDALRKKAPTLGRSLGRLSRGKSSLGYGWAGHWSSSGVSRGTTTRCVSGWSHRCWG